MLLDLSATRAIEVAAYGWSEGALHPHRPDPPFHDLAIILEGSWSVPTSDTEYRLEAGDVLLLPAHRLHSGREPCARGTRWMYVHFTPAPRDRLVSAPPRALPDEIIALPLLSRAALDASSEPLVHAIVRGHWSGSREGRLASRLALAELLLTLARRGAAASVADRAVAAVIERIEADPLAGEDLDELARRAGCSRRSLTRRFRAATGQSVHRFRIGLRLRRARALLHDHPQMPLREIAAATGFADEFHLGKVFRGRFGLPPGEARRRALRRP
jgi:AraC-like DNA-binding protein